MMTEIQIWDGQKDVSSQEGTTFIRKKNQQQNNWDNPQSLINAFILDLKVTNQNIYQIPQIFLENED